MRRQDIVERNLAQHHDWLRHVSKGTPVQAQIAEIGIRSASFLAELMYSTKGSVLDVGSGAGLNSEMLKSIFGFDYHCIEAIPDLAEEYGAVQMFMEDLPPGYCGGFDYIYVNQVIEHCEDLTVAVKALCGVMHSKSVLGIAFPDMEDEDPAHLSRVTIPRLRAIFHENGLRERASLRFHVTMGHDEVEAEVGEWHFGYMVGGMP